MTTINIYPDCDKPDWVEVGEWCYVRGEAYDLFRITQVLDKAAVLEGYYNKVFQGTESFTKMHRKWPKDYEMRMEEIVD